MVSRRHLMLSSVLVAVAAVTSAKWIPPEFKPKQATAGSADPPKPPYVPKCPKVGSPTAYLTDPDDCSKYFVCANGQVWHLPCPIGTAFNAATYVCGFPDAGSECIDVTDQDHGGPLFRGADEDEDVVVEATTSKSPKLDETKKTAGKPVRRKKPQQVPTSESPKRDEAKKTVDKPVRRNKPQQDAVEPVVSEETVQNDTTKAPSKAAKLESAKKDGATSLGQKSKVVQKKPENPPKPVGQKSKVVKKKTEKTEKTEKPEKPEKPEKQE